MTGRIGETPAPSPFFGPAGSETAQAKQLQLALEQFRNQLTTMTPTSAQNDSDLQKFQAILLALHSSAATATRMK